MYIDFHYYMIRVLAEKAGFQKDEAQLIAYTSQFVDDGIDYMPFVASDLPSDLPFGSLIQEESNGFAIFDPACTAHDGFLMHAAGSRTIAQVNTYIPFHFLPAKKYLSGDYDYRTHPDGEIAREVIEAALAALKSAGTEASARRRALIKLGIAIHSYADTWAHQNFSGRIDDTENHCAEIEVFASEWKPRKPGLTILPAIGHARAAHLPDEAFLKWRYTDRTTDDKVDRDNPSDFLAAAKKIFDVFTRCTGKAAGWTEDLERRVHTCLAYRVDDINDDNYIEIKSKKYVAEFPEIEFCYSKETWRAIWQKDVTNIDQLAVQAHGLARPGLGTLAVAGLVTIWRFKSDAEHGRDWCYFQIGALEQRALVKRSIKPLPEGGTDGMGDSVTNFVETGLWAWIDQTKDDLGLNETYRRLRPALTDVKQKGRYIIIKVENKTPFPISWTGRVHLSSGKFWDGMKPQNIPAGAGIAFAGCNRDEAIAGVSGAAMFAVNIRNDKSESFAIAFSHPVEASFSNAATRWWNTVKSWVSKVKAADTLPPRKCQATFGDDNFRAYGNLTDGDKADEIQIEVDGGCKRLRLKAIPGETAHVILSLHGA